MISVLMPVYNVEKYLEKTLESVKAQTYTNFEVIMVDDGSTDSSGAICDKWAENDSRFKVVHTENRGVSAARNTALSLVNGDYIFFMDSDEIILPETLEELFAVLIKNDVAMSYGNVKHIDTDNIHIDKKMDNLTPQIAIYALDVAIINFAKCVKGGFYYGKAKKQLNSNITFFLQHIPSFCTLSSYHKKVALIGFAIRYFPDLFAKYIDFKCKNKTMSPVEAIKEELFDFIFYLFSLLPTKDRIIFESNPELTCNTYPVYNYLLEKGLNSKYEFVWLCNDASKYTDAKEKNISFLTNIKHAKSIGGKFKYMYCVATAKALVYSNQLLGVHGKNRISLWLQHGMPLKASNGTYCIKDKCTAALCVSEFFADNFSTDARVDKDKMIFCGFPRNDYLNKFNDSLEKFGFDKFDKVIFWLPTFRQRNDASKNKKVADFEMKVHGTGIPAIETAEDMQKVNDYLRALNCLVVLKPHPAQDVSAITEKGLSNFFIISDSTLKEKGVQLYELLGRCDAMITDYSSVYYDYLLTDKPIGLTIGDIDEYIAKRGFVYKNPLDILKGFYIKSTDDLITFIGEISNGADSAKKERTKVKNMIHTITDGTSAQRVGDYIIEQLGKQ